MEATRSSGGATPSAPNDVPAFALGRLGRIAHTTVDHAFAQSGIPELSARTYFVLRCLREDGPSSQRELADRTSIDRSDLVKFLDRLERSGYIRRELDKRDRRRHLVSITPAGVPLVDRGLQLLNEASAELYAGLDADEQAMLHRLVRQALTTNVSR